MEQKQQQTSMNRPISQSLKEYARGIAGGLLFSFPLLYTMEVWWSGFIVTSLDLIVLIVVTYLLLLGYNRFAGMRPDVSWRSVFVDSVEEMGIGFSLSFLMLLMLGRIDFDGMSVQEIMGKVVIEAMAVSIGVSVGTAQLGIGRQGDPQRPDKGYDSPEKDEKGATGTMAAVVLSICGAILVGGNVAPTEEVLLIAVEAKPIQILFMAILSLALSVIVIYFSDFKGTPVRLSGVLVFDVAFDACLSYLVALTASAFALWFFGRFDNMSFWIAFSQCITLGVIATLGASAGRLLIK
ncbi:TIGR02587 family membrane protein [Pontibacter diazotrophicus]|uniref:TIGR02587 family membrane protein n=1 Tax=Pontibacter diazotrophicus TaxID=1400979 RepID=A0A3D8LCC2_9BACT|nr:TIGR02587 family membrane protein [Pontibacter diazotrophicus]RDV14936.1 TIGR02587 family membrane protein [Pontibacter diazotrophicus]